MKRKKEEKNQMVWGYSNPLQNRQRPTHLSGDLGIWRFTDNSTQELPQRMNVNHDEVSDRK